MLHGEVCLITINCYYSYLPIRCGHCKILAPQYSKAAATLKEQGSNVKLAKIDATEEKELGERHAVTGYPTLFMYRHGDRYDYKGPRDHHGNTNIFHNKNLALVSWTLFVIEIH